jgi:hypothetical protein
MLLIYGTYISFFLTISSGHIDIVTLVFILCTIGMMRDYHLTTQFYLERQSFSRALLCVLGLFGIEGNFLMLCLDIKLHFIWVGGWFYCFLYFRWTYNNPPRAKYNAKIAGMNALASPLDGGWMEGLIEWKLKVQRLF